MANIRLLLLLSIIIHSIKLVAFEFRPIRQFVLADYTTGIMDATFSPDGTKISTISRAGEGTTILQIWDANLSFRIQKIESKKDRNRPGRHLFIPSAIFSPDGKKIVANIFGSFIRVLDAKTGAKLFDTAPLNNNRDDITKVVFSRDSKKIAIISDETARILNADTGAELLNLSTVIDAPRSINFNSDATKVITTTSDLVQVWDAQGTEILRLTPPPPHRNFSGGAQFSPDDSKIFVEIDKYAQVWNANTGEKLFGLVGLTGWIRNSTFSPDGSKILTMGAEMRANVWDATTGAKLFDLAYHPDTVTSASFSPDGKKILTGSRGYLDRQTPGAKVSDATTGSLLYTINATGESILSAKFSPDSTKVVIASDILRMYREGEPTPSWPNEKCPAEVWILPPDELRNPETLTMITYVNMIKDFMANSQIKDYGHFITFLHNQNPKKTIGAIWSSEKQIFDYLSAPTQVYLRLLIPGRPR